MIAISNVSAIKDTQIPKTKFLEEDLSGLADEAVTWRLGQAAEARNKAVRSENEDRAQYDVGENGARLNREERDAFGALLERIGYSKK